MEQMWEFISRYLPVILTAAVGWGWTRISKVVQAVKEINDLLVSIVSAFELQEGETSVKITAEEIKKIRKEAIEALASIKAIFK